MIYVNAASTVKNVKNFWNNILFHPTDAIEDDWGKTILDRVSADRVADTVRIYTMMEDIYTLDADGKLHEDYALTDLRLDYLIDRGFDVLLSYGFLPPFMTADATLTSSVSKGKTRYKGKMITTSRCTDFEMWGEICYRYTKHLLERYGIERLKKWRFQCYNEPDIGMFFRGDLGGTTADCDERLQDYCKLYRAFEEGVTRACQDIRIGGPALAVHDRFLDGFLQYTKGNGIRIDFVSFHTYGRGIGNRLKDGTAHFHAENTLILHNKHVSVIEKYYRRDEIELLCDEWGMAAGGFCNIDDYPEFIIRETSAFAAYMGKMIDAYIRNDVWCDMLSICLSGQHEMVKDFTGFRNFFTLHGIAKPIYNAFILMRKVRTTLIDGTSGNTNLAVLPTKDENGVSVLLAYASEHFDKVLPVLRDTVHIEGVTGAKHIRIWCIDERHINPYMLAVRNNWGDTFTDEQIALLKEEGTLKVLEECDVSADGALDIPVTLYDNALCMIEVETA